MEAFHFENRTEVWFGKGCVSQSLPSLLKRYGDTVMLAYGGGSIKRNGVYDEVMGILNAAGKRVVEFDRIMPNPTYAKTQEGAKLARENHVDLILAVGGGSVSDCCKVISAQAKLDEDIWEMENTKYTWDLKKLLNVQGQLAQSIISPITIRPTIQGRCSTVRLQSSLMRQTV